MQEIGSALMGSICMSGERKSETTDTQPVRIEGCEFLVTVPRHAGRVIGMCNYRGRLILTTESGDVYAWDGERQELSLNTYLKDRL